MLTQGEKKVAVLGEVGGDTASELEKLSAALNDVKLGDVVSVSEVLGGGGRYFAGGVREVALAAGLGGGGGPIAPGELELTLQLEIVYTVQ